MNYFVRNITEDIAKIVLGWKYEPPYDFYNSKITKENVVEIMEHGYMGVVNERDEVIGFFCTGTAAQVPVGHVYHVYEDGWVDIGLGLRPDLTGKGFGAPFLRFILDYAKTAFQTNRFRLTVAAFNHRAIHLYETVGFKSVADLETDSGGFLVMVLE